MAVWRILATLWSLLDGRKRAHFLLLIATLVVSGVLEMTGMVFLFGYVRGLAMAGGKRAGPVAALIEAMTGPLTQLQYVVVAGLVVVGVLALKNSLASLAQFALSRFLMKLNARISTQLFEGYLLARFDVFGARGVAEPLASVARIFDLFGLCFGALTQILADAAIVLAVALLLVIVDPWLTIGGLLLFGVAGAFLQMMSRRAVAQMGQVETEERRRQRQYLSEGFHGLIEGRLNGTRDIFVRNYSSALGRTSMVRRRRELIGRLPRSLNEMLLAAAIVGAVTYLTLQGKGLADALPTLTMFAFAGLRLTAALSRISQGLQKVQERMGEFAEFDGTLREVVPELVQSGETLPPAPRYLTEEENHDPGEARLRGVLAARGVVFRYPSAAEPALKGVDLEIRRGDFVAICGLSGGGKTTLMLCLMGMLRPQEGVITSDDRDIGTMISSWHRNIGYVGQRAFIAPRSVRENVTFGAPPAEVSDDRVWQALEMAAAADFVRQLPEGLDTRLSDGGSALSGGQRQRIFIARALYRDPEVLFFDEATAALDNVTEQAITEAVNQLSGTKTVVVIAHRLSTIVNADRIYVLNDGCIAGSGRYDELLQTNEAFQRLALAGRSGS